MKERFAAKPEEEVVRERMLEEYIGSRVDFYLPETINKIKVQLLSINSLSGFASIKLLEDVDFSKIDPRFEKLELEKGKKISVPVLQIFYPSKRKKL